MGKGDLWDDSALIKAFDGAISKYKVMHAASGLTEDKIPIINAQDNLPVNGSTEHVQNDNPVDAALDTAEKIVETVKDSQDMENHASDFDFALKHASASNTQIDNLPPINENDAVESDPSVKYKAPFDVKSQNEVTWGSNDPEECNRLWYRYYELEDERQKIIQQLNQYSNWNYQNSDPSACTPEEPQKSVPQPYETFTCYCPYGCQNWVVPCNSSPACCSGGTSTDKCCTGTLKDAREDSDIVKTGMAAAEIALASLTKGTSIIDVSAVGGIDKEFGMERGHSTESNSSGTDLAVVLNAWYSAGLHTGKYLSEQSFEKRKRG